MILGVTVRVFVYKRRPDGGKRPEKPFKKPASQQSAPNILGSLPDVGIVRNAGGKLDKMQESREVISYDAGGLFD